MKTGGCNQPEHRSHSSMPVPVSYLYSPAISFCCGNHNSAVNTGKREISSRESQCVGFLFLYLNVTDNSGVFFWSHMCTNTYGPLTTHVRCTRYIQATCDLAPDIRSAARKEKIHMYCHFSSFSHPPSAPAFP